MATINSATKAKNKYNEKTYDRIMLNLKKGDKSIIDEFIKKHRYESRNIFIRDAIFEKIKKEDF